MNFRLILMLLLALGLAAGSAWIAFQWVESQSSPAADTKQEVIAVLPVVVAADAIAFGTKLEESQLKQINWPKSGVPKGAFKNLDQVVGKIVNRRFEENEIFLTNNISEHLGGSTLSALIAQGNRAMSVRVDDVVGVAGFILPGNTVDILATRKKGKTYTVLRNVKVLAVDQEASPDKEKPAVVRALTLEVTPGQAETLVNATQTGSLRFTLRNPVDKAVEKKLKTTVTTQKGPNRIKKFSWTNETLSICKNIFC